MDTIEQDMEKRAPISVKFEIPYFTVSGIQVRYLKIVEKSGYQALPWVRYITQNGDDYRSRASIRVHFVILIVVISAFELLLRRGVRLLYNRCEHIIYRAIPVPLGLRASEWYLLFGDYFGYLGTFGLSCSLSRCGCHLDSFWSNL